MQKVITVNDYAVTPDDPNDWVSIPPNETLDLFVVSQYHYYRTGLKSVDFNGPAGAEEEYVRWLPEGDNGEGSEIVVGDPQIIDEATFKCTIICKPTKRGDNFILYFRTWSKDVVDWRWPKHILPGRPRNFQVHLHIGESIDEYVNALKGEE